MARLIGLASAIVAVTAILTAPVDAATVSIRLSEAGFASITTSSNGDTLVWNSPFGTFTTDIDAAALSSSPLLIDLGSTNFSSASAGVLTVEITASGLSAPAGFTDFEVQLSGHEIYGATPGWVSIAAYVDNSNTPFGTATALASSSIIGLPTYFSASRSAEVMSLFSITEVLTIQSGGSSAFSLDASLSGSVPEASTWTMMFAGFAGLGLAAFRKKRKVGCTLA